jgi:hypothetical protein
MDNQENIEVPGKFPTPLNQWIQLFRVDAAPKASSEPEVKYHVSFNKADPEAELKYKYPSNMVITSKYTGWNFVPKNLFNQASSI